MQILWINLIVAVALALPLAFEAPEPDLMRRPPRDRAAPLLDRPLLVRTLLVVRHADRGRARAVRARRAHARTSSLARAQTTAVTGAVLLQALYLLACRSLTRPNRELGRWSNPAVYVGHRRRAGLQALFVYAPFMQAVFGSAALGARELAWAARRPLVVLPVTGSRSAGAWPARGGEPGWASGGGADEGADARRDRHGDRAQTTTRSVARPAARRQTRAEVGPPGRARAG